MKLFRSKSQSSSPNKSPSATSRLGRMLSPSSRSNVLNRSPSPSLDAPKYRIPTPSFEPSTPLYDPAQSDTRPPAPQPSRQPSEFTPLQQGRHDDPQGTQRRQPPLALQFDGTIDDDDRLDAALENDASQIGTDVSAPFDERAMTRKLMDVESSFVPEQDYSLQDSRQRPQERGLKQEQEQGQAQAQEQGTFSADAERFPFTQESQKGSGSPGVRTAKSQTFFEWGPGLSLPRSPSVKAGSRVISEGFKPHGSPAEDFEVERGRAEREQGRETEEAEALAEEQRKELVQQQAQDVDEDEVDYGDSTLESPTTAVSQRYGIGAAPVRTAQDYRLQQEGTADEEDLVPERAVSSTQHEDESSAVTVVIEDRPAPQQRAVAQRAQLRDRHVSQESYVSGLSEALSESTIGADYALQTGGATSARRDTKPSRDEMLRLPSFGSVASSLSADEPSVVKHSAAQNPSLLLDDQAVMIEKSSQLDLATPRATRRLIPDPSETVLNQHVRDVQVPATVARQYRASHQPAYLDDKEIVSSPHYGHSKNSLTLKEQNSKIDKLTKENFDLKLKIHFLHQALQDRSEEGVRDLISKNAAYQAELVKAKKDAQTLRKKLKALERQLANQHGRASIATTATTSQAGSEEGSGSHALNDSGDLVFWKEKALLLETENEKLVQVWQHVLNEEMDRRRAAELKVQQLQQELDTQRKQQRSPLRKLTLRRSQRRLADDDSTSNGKQSELNSRSSFATQDRTHVPSLGGTTVVDQLRQENITLRRDLDVQTDMLSSRNRERERLQQEIETLKLITRREESAKSSAGDSILERSISRQQYRRPASRASMTHSQMSDAERERYESMHAHLRDENSTLKMRLHDLSREMDELESRHVSRDEADQALREADADIQYLTDAVRHLEKVLQEKDHQINGLWADLRAREDENDSFKRDLMSISNSLDEVAGDRNGSQELINNLQADLDQANADLESLEKTLHNISTAKERLEVQQESAQNEIAFLREEQESDKLKIGDLQTALGNANTNLQNEIERLKQLDQLEADATQAREDGHRLRQALVAREAELNASSEKVKSLERSLRDHQSTTSSSTSKDLAALRRDLDNALTELNHANSSIREKDREIIEREDLLDEMTVEIRDLNSRLDNEIQSRVTASAASQSDKQAQQRLAALEQARASERQQYATLLKDRNDLLHAMLTRLSNLCGPAWKSRHAPPILASDPTLASRSLPQLEAMLLSATKHIEHTITSFSAKINSIEGELYNDVEILNSSLDSRIRRLDHLDKAVQRITAEKNAKSADTTKQDELLAQLKDDNKTLQRELKRLKQNTSTSTSNFELPGLPPQDAHTTALTTTSHHSNGLGLARTTTSTSTGGYTTGPENVAANEQKWVLRIEEMNRRLRAEREGRLLDREGAQRRLMEGQREIGELRRELERRERGGMGASAGVGMQMIGEGVKRGSKGPSEASVD